MFLIRAEQTVAVKPEMLITKANQSNIAIAFMDAFIIHFIADWPYMQAFKIFSFLRRIFRLEIGDK